MSEGNNKKFKILCRNPKDYVRETKNDIHIINRFSTAITENPFIGEQERIKAVNAAKTQRILGKPFVKAMQVGMDEVQCFDCDPDDNLVGIFSTSDGHIQYWNYSSNKPIFNLKCHQGLINAVCYYESGKFITAGQDKYVKLWDIDNVENNKRFKQKMEPDYSFCIEDVPNFIDCQLKDQYYAIASSRNVEIYDRYVAQASPVETYGKTSGDSHYKVKFSVLDKNIFATTLGNKNAVHIFDIRQPQIAQKIELKLRANCLSFSPYSITDLVLGSADYNCYTFDLKNLKLPRLVHKGHTNAVLDVNFNRKGTEFVSASVDKTIRIFRRKEYMSRDVYFSKRMPTVNYAKFSSDDGYIITGSTDGFIRLWKSNSSEKMGPMNPRERNALAESRSLVRKYQHDPEINQIVNHRLLPKNIKHGNHERRIHEAKRKRKQRNEMHHSGKVTKITSDKEHAMTDY